MSAVLTLDQLNQDDEGFELGNAKAAPSQKPFFETDKAYAVTITEIVPKLSTNGYLQAEVALQFTGSDKKAGRQWIMLPVFTKDMAASIDNEKLANLKEGFGKRFQAFLRAAAPAEFSVYDRLDKNGKQWTFYAHDGSVLTAAQKKVRERDVSKAVIETGTKIATGVDTGLVGREVYLVITQDKNDAKRTYANWYAEQPTKYELAEIG